MQSSFESIEIDINLLKGALNICGGDDDISKARKIIQKGIKGFLGTSFKLGTGTGTGKKI